MPRCHSVEVGVGGGNIGLPHRVHIHITFLGGDRQHPPQRTPSIKNSWRSSMAIAKETDVGEPLFGLSFFMAPKEWHLEAHH